MKSDQGTYCKWHDKIYSEMGWKKQYHFWPDSLTRTEPLNSQVGFQDFSNFGWNYRQACVQIPLSPEVPGLNYFFFSFWEMMNKPDLPWKLLRICHRWFSNLMVRLLLVILYLTIYAVCLVRNLASFNGNFLSNEKVEVSKWKFQGINLDGIWTF